jgi:hypothetical protein
MGDHVFSKIIAINLYGNSLPSLPGDGAIVIFVPDAPLNLANNAAITSSN